MIRSIGLSVMKIIGRNTTTVVNVESSTASPTSPAPSAAASRIPRPSARRRVMFSATTIALSTNMPIASVMPVIARTLNVPPVKYIQAIASKSERGIDSATTSVSRTRHRNRNSTTTASTPPSSAVSSSCETEERMNCPWSKITMKRNSPASAGSRSSSAIAVRSRSQVSTTFDCASFLISP
jgi:hypothetical protein